MIIPRKVLAVGRLKLIVVAAGGGSGGGGALLLQKELLLLKALPLQLRQTLLLFLTVMR